MDFQAYNKILICNDKIKNAKIGDTVIGYVFQIKYPSYRGAFLSCIEDLCFYIDGSLAEREDIRFKLNGKDFLLDELPECYKEYWYVREKASIFIRRPGGLTAGKHEVRVYMKHRVPYTGYFGEYLVLESDVTKYLSAE